MKFFTETTLKRHKKVIYKIKRFSSISLVIFVALASIASSFFVYPVQKAYAVDCADTRESNNSGVVYTSKPQLRKGEPLRWFAYYGVPPGTTNDDDKSCKENVTVNFWVVIGRGGVQNIKYKGVWDDQINGYKAGGEFVPTVQDDTQLPADFSLRVYVEEDGDDTSPLACATTICTADSVADQANNFKIVPNNTDTSATNPSPPPFAIFNSSVLGSSAGIFDGKTFEYSDLKIDATTAQTYGIVPETDITIKYGLNWGAGTKSPPPLFGSDSLNTNTAIANPVADPTIMGLYLGLNFPGSIMDCLGGGSRPTGWSELDCQAGIINEDLVEIFESVPVTDKTLTIPYAWIKDKVTPAPTEGKPTTVKITFFPVISLKYGPLMATALAGCTVGGTVTGASVLAWLAGASCDDLLNTDKAYSNTAKTFDIKVYATQAEIPEDELDGAGEVTTTGTDTTNPNDKTNGFNGVVDFIAKVIGTILWFIQVLIFNIFASVILPLLVALLSIRTYTDAFALVILPGWELLRNLANIFFIVVLLVIGLATLFRVSKYQYRTLLVHLILAALLVNFSLIITQSVVAVAETVQHQFLPEEDKGIAIRVIANKLMIPPLEQGNLTPAEFTVKGRLSDSLSRLIFPFFYLSLSIMAFVVMTSLVFFVLIRMLVIWVLLMTSPLAFVAWILPDTKQWTSKWMGYLLKYAFFVTILAFFLNISATVAQKQAGVLKGLYQVNESSSLADFLSRIATNIFVMGFLVAGIYVAQSSGVIGAKTLGKYAKMGGQLPFKALAGAGKLAGSGAKALGERGFEGIQNVTGITMDPREIKKGKEMWKAERAKEKAERLRQRKLGENTWAGKAFGSGFGAAVASPEQMFENLGSAKGAKTMLKKITGRRDKLKEKEEAAKQRAEGVRDIMTEDEREYLGEELDRLKSEHSQGGIQHGNDGAKELSDQIDGELDKIQKQKQELAKGSDPDKLEKNKKLDQQKQAWEKAKEELEKSDEGEVDVGAIKQGLEAIDGTVAAAFVKKAEAIKDQLPESKNNTEEIENLEKSMKKDDELRVANGFSEFDSAQPPGYVKFASKEKSDIDTALSKASEAARGMDFKRLMKASVETAKDEAKIEADFKDRGIHDDHGALIAEFDAAYGKKNQKDIQAVVQRLIASNGYSGQMLEHYGYEKSALGMREFMKDKMGIEEKSADKRSLALLSKLDEINRKNGNHGLGSMTQRVGQNIVMRTVESQAAAYGKEVANQNTNSFLQSPDTNILASEVDKTSGKTTERLTDPAVKRIKSMSGSDAAKLISRMSPGVRRRIVKSENYQSAGFNPTIKAALEGRYKK